MSDWVETTLGQLFEVDNSRLGGYREEPCVMSLSKYEGFVRADSYFGKRIASDKLDGYKVVEPGEWAFSTIHIDEGSIARNNLGVRGVISPMYTTLHWAGGPNLPEYAELIVREPRMLAEYANRAQGSVNRRRSLSFKSFASIAVVLPLPSEQRRIVDLMTAVATQIEALKSELERGRRLLDVSIADALAVLPDTRVLGEFTTCRSGPSYSAAEVSRDPSAGAVPTIGIPNTKPDGSFTMSDIGYVSGLGDAPAKIDESSLILIRTNGNRQRIGNVYIPPREAHGHIVSAFQFLMKVENAADREFVYWVLREPRMQAAMSDAASGTTGLGNLAVKWINSVRVKWSDDEHERVGAIRNLRAEQNNLDALRVELSDLRAFRSALLAAILNQDVVIPESYDLVLEGGS